MPHIFFRLAVQHTADKHRWVCTPRIPAGQGRIGHWSRVDAQTVSTSVSDLDATCLAWNHQALPVDAAQVVLVRAMQRWFQSALKTALARQPELLPDFGVQQ